MPTYKLTYEIKIEEWAEDEDEARALADESVYRSFAEDGEGLDWKIEKIEE